jgi:hypothetical protein
MTPSGHRGNAEPTPLVRRQHPQPWKPLEGAPPVPHHHRIAYRSSQGTLLTLCLLLAACANPPQNAGPEYRQGTAARGGMSGWEGRPLGTPPPASPALKQAIISRAVREWEFFGHQTVILSGTDESIPHVGVWEDDDSMHSGRVNTYWRSVGKEGLSGMDCQKPWSAAFISWVMQMAGVPESQFPRASAHWVYLSSAIDGASLPGRFFVPRRIMDYSPKPGDLVCAYRGIDHPSTNNGYTSTWAVRGANSHCDLVVAKSGQTLDVVGGNVRNSVSKTNLELDAQGHLLPVPKRPWFLVLENRL